MDVNQFIQNVISGNAVEAKESLNDILSSRAFTSLDEYKKEIAQKLYATEEDVEVQNTADSEIEEDDLLTQEEFDSLSEEDQQMYLEALEQLDELSKTTLRNYLKGSRQENQGGLGSAGHMSDKARSLGRTDQDKEDGRYEGAKRAKRKLSKEEVEQIDELKKSTLGSYVKKASKNLANQSFDHGEDEHRQYGDPEDTEREADMKKRERDIENRQKGINRAASKLSKEEVEQIDEVGDTPAGKKMLGSYLKKRTKQIPGIERNYQMTPYEDGPMGAKTIKKFQKKVNKGMGRAIDRLTK